jgi:hypothetical protein
MALFIRNSKVQRFIILQDDVIHAYLGCNVVAIQNDLTGIASQIKKMPGKCTSGINSTHGINKVILCTISNDVSLGGVRLSPLGTSATVGLLYQPRMIDDYGAVGGMRIGRGNQSTRRKPAPVTLCPPQILHDLGSNPGHRGGKPATNHLRYGTAK